MYICMKKVAKFLRRSNILRQNTCISETGPSLNVLYLHINESYFH